MSCVAKRIGCLVNAFSNTIGATLRAHQLRFRIKEVFLFRRLCEIAELSNHLIFLKYDSHVISLLVSVE